QEAMLSRLSWDVSFPLIWIVVRAVISPIWVSGRCRRRSFNCTLGSRLELFSLRTLTKRSPILRPFNGRKRRQANVSISLSL
ncbi:hypothetical protein EDB92DRAFT_1834415, partial [Lactarius akahatsu]